MRTGGGRAVPRVGRRAARSVQATSRLVAQQPCNDTVGAWASRRGAEVRPRGGSAIPRADWRAARGVHALSCLFAHQPCHGLRVSRRGAEMRPGGGTAMPRAGAGAARGVDAQSHRIPRLPCLGALQTWPSRRGARYFCYFRTEKGNCSLSIVRRKDGHIARLLAVYFLLSAARPPVPPRPHARAGPEFRLGIRMMSEGD